MTLLRDIQEVAASGDTRVSDLLRKCKILAVRLQSPELGAWVDCELNGYDSSDELPDYRKANHAEIKGHFVGYFGKELNNAPIPIQNLPPDMWQDYMGLTLPAGVANYEHLLVGDSPVFKRPIPSDLVLTFASNVYQDMNCLQAWVEIPRGALVKVLDAVRNKVLGFALDIEKENPQAGEADVSSDNAPVPQPVVSHVFNNNIYGNVANLASGSHDFSQNSTINQQNLDVNMVQLSAELTQLRKVLIAEATEPEHFEAISAIRSAEIEAEKKNTPKLIQALAKAGTWALNIGSTIGTTVAVEAIKKSMGIQSP